METKNLNLSSLELKFDEQTKGVFSGYASVFGGVDSYGDTILPGAYKKTLKNRDRAVQLRWNHWGPVIGKWLEISEDDKGLFVRGELTPGHSVAEDAYALLKHQAVNGMSIGYRPVQIRELGNGQRELKEIELIEISIVESPADTGARISDVKTALDAAESLKELEAILREVGGFSRTDATALVSRIKSLAHGERVSDSKTGEIALAIRAATQKLTQG